MTRIRITTAVGIALGLIWSAPAGAALTAPVRTQAGLVSGAPGRDASVMAFKGLPYAAPPVGNLRWRPPAPPARWEGVRAADQFGPICPQPQGASTQGRTIDEDCLNLNVWTGARSSAERRPVMVWFYGGDADLGSGSNPAFDGEALAKKGAVVVTANYRGGPLGFLATPELSKESGHNASGEYNLLDHIAALKWVQQNIAAFGGDPRNVTLFGQSAGAGAQGFLALSPLAKGLFQKMILQSHARYPRDPALFEVATGYQSLKDAEANGVRYEQALGVHSLAELRQVPWQKLIEVFRAEPRGTGWRRAVDGWVIPRNYSDTYAAGTQNDVMVIAGDNKDESDASPDSAFDLISAGKRPGVRFPGAATLAQYVMLAHQKFGPMADEFLKLYPASNDREAFLAASAAARDTSRVSTWLWASLWRQKASKPVYLYFWTHAPPGPNHDLTGAYHGSEIAYVFNHAFPATATWTDEDRRIADTMSSYWVNFARRGNPNGPGLPVWPAFKRDTQQVMELGDQFRPIPLADPAKVDFWRRFYENQPAA